jgi:hypothetical protein
LARQHILIAAACAAALATASVPARAADSLLISARGSANHFGQVIAIGNFRPGPDSTLAAAIRAYGDPSSRRGTGSKACDVRWSPLGVRILFADFGGGVACRPADGNAQSATVSGTRNWHTGNGLSLGDSVSRLRDLYPRARRHGRLFWLRSAYTIIGKGGRYPVLSARISAGRVTSFHLWIGAAGD